VVLASGLFSGALWIFGTGRRFLDQTEMELKIFIKKSFRLATSRL